MIGDQTVEVYSSRGRVMALYVATIVSCCCPQLVDVREVGMLSVFFALSQMLFTCAVYVCCVSKVTPRILLRCWVGMGVLFMCRLSCVECSRGSGVEMESCVFEGLTCRWFRMVQLCNLLR